MARLFTSGAELQDTTQAGTDPDGGVITSTNVTIDTTHQRSGGACWKVAPLTDTNAYAFFSFTGALATDYYARMYIMFLQQADMPVSTASIFIFTVGTGTPGLTTTNTSTGWSLVGVGGGTSAEIPYGQYARVEIHIKTQSGSNDDTFEAALNGFIFDTGTTRNLGTVAPSGVRVGFPGSVTPGSSKIVYLDDFALNDSTGANQNSWPGPGKVILLKPISDNAGGTGWTLGTGTALGGNGFAAVDNTPPLGVADLAVGSDPKQIRNATANANVNYDANMTSYTTGGLSVSDKVRVVVPIIATGAPVSTSAKAGTVGVVSNPAITNVALGAQGTSGAFWSGTAAGTYISGWKWSFGTTTYDPAVTKGTAPVMRVTQVTSSTRIAMVSFMGMYVEYSPASLVAPTSQHLRKIGHRRVAANYDRW